MNWYLDNNLVRYIQKCDRFNGLTDVENKRLYSEICNATLQEIDEQLLDDALQNKRGTNKSNSLLLWVLGIVDEKPDGYQKISSPGGMPDIDVDIPQASRMKVIDYTKQKYGEDKVCQIATFGKLAAKAAVRSSARALGYKVDDGDYVAKLIPNLPGITLDDSIAANEVLQDIVNKKQEPYFSILTVARSLEGLPNATGVHASAIVIADKTLQEYFPLMVSKKDGAAVLSQIEAKDVEESFLCKMDYLGLKSLDIISETCKLIEKNHGVIINPYKIDLDSPEIYKLINDGHNTLLFQIESDTMASAIQKMKPKNINELSDLLAIVRPGPLELGVVESYVNAKFTKKWPTFDLKDQNLIDVIHRICKTSYGNVVYQEQLMAMISEIASFNEIESDNIRRATGKKDAKILEKVGEEFVIRGVKNGYSKTDLTKLFEQLAGFSSYSFNKSHSVSYSFLTTIMGYLSANYKLEFYAAALSIDSGNLDDVRRYIYGAKKRGIKIDPPRINESLLDFSISGDKIVFGLGAIKGVGEKLSRSVIKNRPKGGYLSFGHFVIRNIDNINKKVLDSYTKAGLFYDFGISKNTILHSIDNILEFVSDFKELCKNGNILSFLNEDIYSYIDNILLVPSSEKDDLYYEIEAIGIYITDHPMNHYTLASKDAINIRSLIDTNIDNIGYKQRFLVPGVITGIEIRKTKAKTNMASFLLTDAKDSIKMMVFPKCYSQYMEKIKEGKICIFNCAIKEEDGTNFLVAQDIFYPWEKPTILGRIIHSEDEIGFDKKKSVNHIQIGGMTLNFKR